MGQGRCRHANVKTKTMKSLLNIKLNIKIKSSKYRSSEGWVIQTKEKRESQKSERNDRGKTVFFRSHNNELKSLERGRAFGAAGYLNKTMKSFFVN